MTQTIKKSHVVCILQCAAAVMFIVACAQAGISINNLLIELKDTETALTTARVIKVAQTELYYVLYEPLILLGLAEIIKSMKEKKNDQN